MSELIMFILGIAFGWVLSCQFATPCESKWSWEEIPPSSKVDEFRTGE